MGPIHCTGGNCVVRPIYHKGRMCSVTNTLYRGCLTETLHGTGGNV